MKERPIIFSGAMVRAILDGTKTQTRLLVKSDHVPVGFHPRALDVGVAKALTEFDVLARCLHGVPGDRLWVRETHAIVPASAFRCSREEDGSPVPHVVSAAGDEWAVFRAGWSRSAPSRWRSSIHMPRWASRLTLEVTGVRVERLQSITEEDARAEGVTMGAFSSYADAFSALWDQINGKRAPWSVNPWVWVVASRKVAS